MTKAELIDAHWIGFLQWCTSAPEGKAHELVFWLEHRYPTEDNFWEWMTTVNKDALSEES